MPPILQPHSGITECNIKLIYSSQHFSFASWCVDYELLDKLAQRRFKLSEAFFKLVDEAIPHYALGLHG